MSGNDFFEEDEPIEDVIEAFGSGPHGVTTAPLTSSGTGPVSRWVSNSGMELMGTGIVGTPTYGGQPMTRIP